MILRTARAEDIEEITANNLATALETEGWSLDAPTARRGVEAVIGNPSRGFYLVAEHKGSIVGQCMVTFEWSDWRCGTFYWIQSVYVRKECRKQGVFRRLYQEIEQRAKADPGVVGIRLYVDRDNRPAQEAYRSAGMEEARYTLFEVDFSR